LFFLLKCKLILGLCVESYSVQPNFQSKNNIMKKFTNTSY
jgi:hypothetical protein